MASALKLFVLLSVAIGLLVTTTNVMAHEDDTNSPTTVKTEEVSILFYFYIFSNFCIIVLIHFTLSSQIINMKEKAFILSA